MKSRSLMMVVALCIGALGAMLTYVYVQRVEENTVSGVAPQPVMVATRALPSGSTGEAIVSAGAFEIRNIPARYVSPGAFSSPDQLVGLILVDDIAGGEQLVASRFGGSEADVLFADFPKGTEALSLPLEYITGVSGKLKPGDQINAFVTVSTQRQRGSDLNTGAGLRSDTTDIDVALDEGTIKSVSSSKVFAGQGGETFLLLRKLQIMEVLTGEAAAGNPPTMVLAVNPQEAAILIHAQSTAKLWFTLVPQDGAQL
jgi:Flp pilus assembly protein CpaB